MGRERKGAQGLTVRSLASSYSKMTQFLRDQDRDSEEVVSPLMLDGTYLSRNFATLGPFTRQPPFISSIISSIIRLSYYFLLDVSNIMDMIQIKRRKRERKDRDNMQKKGS